MPRSRYDIANSAIRIFLQEVGKVYDQARGFVPFGPRVAQTDELLEYFGFACCYCGDPISRRTVSFDHLIPMNKVALGLHAWGNVVPCCRSCNNEKQQRNWRAFLLAKADIEFRAPREDVIDSFVALKRYDPSLNLHEYAGNLYEDVGAVAMTLIDLRYKQAELGIQALLSPISAGHSKVRPANDLEARAGMSTDLVVIVQDEGPVSVSGDAINSFINA